MSIIRAIADSASTEVEVGPLVWRVRRVEPADMMRHGLPGVLILQEIINPGKKGAEPASLDPRKMSKGQREKALKAQESFRAMVCAGVTHVRERKGPWEPVSLSMEGPTSDDKLWVNDLPPGTVNAIYPAIFQLSAPEEAVRRLRTFLGEPVEAGDDQEDVPPLREVAT